ncbi:hypothetical protein RFF05_09675 [Bengtsoniella intestinalis]|uniref:hypothetical protein n=1 Tax=Bengtsoniella intestinalis TaxID=3073143 RepID=UPI00391FAE9C
MMEIDSRKIFENNYIYVDSRFGEIMEELRGLNPCGKELPVSSLIRPASVPDWHSDVLLKRFCRLYALGDMESPEWDGSEDFGKMKVVYQVRGGASAILEHSDFEVWLVENWIIL